MLFLGKEIPPLGTTGGGGEILFLSYDVTICGSDIYVILFQKMIWGYWKWILGNILLKKIFLNVHLFFNIGSVNLTHFQKISHLK